MLYVFNATTSQPYMGDESDIIHEFHCLVAENMFDVLSELTKRYKKDQIVKVERGDIVNEVITKQ